MCISFPVEHAQEFTEPVLARLPLLFVLLNAFPIYFFSIESILFPPLFLSKKETDMDVVSNINTRFQIVITIRNEL